MKGPTIVPPRVRTASTATGPVVDPLHDLDFVAADVAPMGPHLRVDQQSVVDLLATLEFDVGLVLRREDPRMGTIPAVVVSDVGEVAHPAVQSEQVNAVAPTK
jgi:hypothetical protein